MLVKVFTQYLTKIVGIIGLTLLFPLAISYIYTENAHDFFLIPTILCLLIGTYSFKSKKAPLELDRRSAVLMVFLVWVIVSIIGALPFYFSHFVPNFVDAFFESVSGFTATGSTILTDIEALPRSLLFWRSETHFLGGMGIIVLALAIFPTMPGKKYLFSSEAPISPDEQKLFPRISSVTRVYWKIYIILTIVQIILLLPVMSLFDAVTHSFACIAGGGFSTKNSSIAYFNSFYVELILSIFMIAGATSFILHYFAMKGKFNKYWKNYSFKLFISVVFIATLTIALYLFLNNSIHYSFLEALRASFFQVVSIITTTGFATADFKYWPAFTQILLIMLMFIGGMSASTSGSIKISRFEVLIKDYLNIFKRMLHPNLVTNIKINRNSLPHDNLHKVQLYAYSYIIIFFMAGLLVTIFENSPLVSFSAVAAALGNVGPGLGSVGPFDNFAHIAIISKLILSGCMLIGRLEIWTVLLMFSTEFWIA